MTDRLPPEVEAADSAAAHAENALGIADIDARTFPVSVGAWRTIRAHLTSQAEEIERLKEGAVNVHDIRMEEREQLRSERDRYKAMANAWEGMAHIVAREGGCEGFLASLIDSPLSPVGRLKAAEEATSGQM